MKKSTLGLDDFSAEVVAQDAIRLDFYHAEGRYCRLVSICQAMSVVIILSQAIEPDPSRSFSMEDFEATREAGETIQLDLYDPDIEGPTQGAITFRVSEVVAMGLAICLFKAIERAEVEEARKENSK